MAPVYTSAVTGTSFRLNTAKLNFSAAEAECSRIGGHLASFSSIDEAVDVEQYYIQQGFLFPEFNQYYWLGLNSSADTGSYKWIGPDVPPTPAYNGWATGQPAANQGMCGAGAAARNVGGTWGWMNRQCSTRYVSVCRINREQRWPGLPHMLHMRCQRVIRAHCIVL